MYTKRKLSQRIMRERINSRFNNKLEESSEDRSFEKFKERYHARRFKEAQLKRVNEAWDDGIDDEIERSRRNYNFARLSDEGRYFSSYDPEEDEEEEIEDEYFIPSEEDFTQILSKGDPEAVPEAAKIIHDWYTRQEYQDDYYNEDDFLKHGLRDIKDWVEEGDFTADHTPIIERALGITKKEESKKSFRKVRESREYFIPNENDFRKVFEGFPGKKDPEVLDKAVKIFSDWYSKNGYDDDYDSEEDFLKWSPRDIRELVEEEDYFTGEDKSILEKAIGITKKEESKKSSVNEKLQEAKDNYGPKAHFYKNGKEISRKRATAWLGAERLKKREDDAFEDWKDDPSTLLDWADGFEIKFEY